MAHDGQNSASAVVSDVEVIKVTGIHVPPFWPECPEVWFQQLEGQFKLNGVTTDSTKFYHAMPRLGRVYAKEVTDITAQATGAQ